MLARPRLSNARGGVASSRHPRTRARAHLAALSWKRELLAVRAHRHPKLQAALPRNRYVPFVPGVGQGLSPIGFRALQAPILVAPEGRPPPQRWAHALRSGYSFRAPEIKAKRSDSARPRRRGRGPGSCLAFRDDRPSPLPKLTGRPPMMGGVRVGSRRLAREAPGDPRCAPKGLLPRCWRRLAASSAGPSPSRWRRCLAPPRPERTPPRGPPFGRDAGKQGTDAGGKNALVPGDTGLLANNFSLTSFE
ncbi:hypothetical protein TcG_02908 [Trypanosoma cruzi]|nr:hypothetical protein TcG_02908 [Trypanosoma cruzi]